MRPVRWVHSSELEDPTAWLKGGELILTTGHGRRRDGGQAARLRPPPGRRGRRRASGSGSGSATTRRPRALVTEADEARVPVVRGAVPRAVHRDHRGRVHTAARRAVRHAAARGRRRARADAGGARGRGGRRRRPVARRRRGRLGAAARPARHAARGDRPGRRGAARADLGRGAHLAPRGRDVLADDARRGATTCGCSRSARRGGSRRSSRSARASSRRSWTGSSPGTRSACSRSSSRSRARSQRPSAASRATSSTSSPAGSCRRPRRRAGLVRFGFARDAQVLVVAIEPVDGGLDPARLALAATDHCSRRDGRLPGLGARRRASTCSSRRADALGPRRARQGDRPARRCGASRGAPAAPSTPGRVGRSLREARYALQVCRLEGWQHAGFEQLGTYRLLLSMTEPDALRAFADALLAPLDAYDADHGGELLGEPPGVPAAQRAVGDGRARSSTCTATRSGTGCARSRS